MKEDEAAVLIEDQITTIAEHWQDVCDEAELSPVDRRLLSGRQFFNSYALDGLDKHKILRDEFCAARNALLATCG